MTDERMKKVIEKIKEQLCGLLDEQTDEIYKSYRKAYTAHEKESAFSFSLSAPIKITVDGPGDKVKSSLKWSERHQVDAEATVSPQGDMIDDLPSDDDEGSTD